MAEIQIPVEALHLDATNPPGIEPLAFQSALLFNDTTDEICYVTFIVPANYSSSPALELIYSMDTATSGAIVMSAEVWANADGEASESASYDTLNASSATNVPGTAGLQDTVTVTLTNFDGAAAGERITLRIRRDADNGGDTATGDLKLHALRFTYTAA